MLLIIISDHSFLWAVEFWAKPRNILCRVIGHFPQNYHFFAEKMWIFEDLSGLGPQVKSCSMMSSSGLQYQFEWPWVTSKPDFKVKILFNVK